MRKLGTMLAVLSLIAMAPSGAYGKTANKQSPIEEIVNNAAAKRLRKFVTFVNNTSTAEPDGSIFKPYTNIAAAVNGSAQGAIIYVLNTGTDYAINVSTTSGDAVPVVLKPRQSLIGSSVPIKVNGKAVAGATPGRRPVISVVGTASVGAITLGNSNRVSGFQFIGTGQKGIVGPRLINSCTITNNQFTNFFRAVSVFIERNTRVEIENNKFIDTDTEVDFAIGKGRIITSVCRNTFEGIGSGSAAAAEYSDVPGLRIGTITTGGVPENFRHLSHKLSDTPVIEETVSEDVTEASLFPSELDLFFFGNTFKGIDTTIALRGASKLIAKGNRWSGVTGSIYTTPAALTLELDSGAKGFLEKNSFFQNDFGFQLSLVDGGIATVSNNTFSQNYEGFVAVGFGAASGVFNCLQLLNNRGKNEELDFALVNEFSPASFRVNVRGNKGTLLVPVDPVVFANGCPGCLKFK